ncbi:MAG: Fur family transcriptional regulator [Candidatus Cryptobacteroides sp.]
MTQQNITDRQIDAFKSMLKKHSLKATPQRLAVHEAMLKLGHASADMVTEEIKANSNTKVTVASVYNILTGLALLGVYSHRLSANNKMYFDVNNFKHIHIYDRENHCYKDYFDEELIKLVEEKLGKKRFKGFKVEDIDIQIIGRPTTRKKSAVTF